MPSGRVYVSQREIDRLIARGASVGVLRARRDAVLKTAMNCDRLYHWPALRDSLREDAARLREAIQHGRRTADL